MITANLLEKAINTYIKLDPESFGQLREVQNYCVKIQLTDLSKQFFLFFRESGIEVRSECFEEPAATLECKSWQLIASSFSHSIAQEIQIRGHVELGYQVYGIFKNIQIDWEEQLSHYTGDIIAHQAGNFVRQLSSRIKNAREHFRENVTEYVQEEAHWFPPVQELEDFYDDVESLNQQVERLEAYLKRAGVLA